MRYKLLYLWQLPQHLVGLLLVWLYKPTRLHKIGDVRFYFSHRMKGGISLGNYIIVYDGHYRKYLRFSLSGSAAATVITDTTDNSAIYVLMPMRI